MNIEHLIKDWAWRVNDGMPDPKNRNHLELLEATLRAHKYNDEFISAYIDSIKNPHRDVKKFQEFCVEVGKIISENNLLTEASVFDNKYSIGAEFIAIKNTDDLFTKGGVTPPKGPFFKSAPVDNAIEVNIGSGITFYIKSGKDVYKITASKAAAKKMFGKVGKGKSSSNVSWNEKTLESAACAGLYFDAISHYNKIMNPNVTLADQQAAISAFEGALGSESAGAGELKGKLAAIPDLLQALQLAIGVQKFAKAHGCTGWNFIHKSINKFYSAGYGNENLDSKGFKDNTADTIITKSSPATLIANIAKDKVTFDSSGKCTTESGDEFYQISNKKSDGGAQLGRIVGSFRDMYGTKSPGDTWRLQLTAEMIKYENSNFILSEGLGDYFKQGLKFIKDTFTDLIVKAKNKVKKFSGGVVKKLSMKTTKPTPKLNSFMKKRFNASSKLIKESKKKYSYNTYAEMCSKLAMQNNYKEIEMLLNLAVGEWSTLKKLLDAPDDGIDRTGDSKPPIKMKISSVDQGIKYVLKLMINVMGYQHLNAMLKSSKGSIKEVSKVLEEFVELEKEMYFGKTELPLFKVYGADPSGKAYEFLKSGKEFREDRLKAMTMNDAVKDGKYIPGVVVDSSLQKDKGHCSIKAWILHSITEKGTQYTQVDFRSGSESTLSFSVSGGSVIPGRRVLGKI